MLKQAGKRSGIPAKHLMIKYLLKVAFICLIIPGTLGCRKNVKPAVPTGAVMIRFIPVVNAAPLDFTTTFENAFQEPYVIRSFKYYIHNIELIRSDHAKEWLSRDHFLIDAGNNATTAILLKAPEQSYHSIAFTLGVDSIRNVSGAQTGALDPANGMFWTWNSGYIMSKFEGVSTVSAQPGNRFEYHIGGFKAGEQVIRRIELPFPANATVQVAKDKTATINIHADANAWFDGVSPLPIAEYPVCMTAGTLARSFAANYATMFTISNIEIN